MKILLYAQLVLLVTPLDLVLGCSTKYHIRVATGTIKSPNYPGIHNNNECRIWIIAVIPGKYVGLTFTDFTLESCCDFVEIRSGQTSSSPLIGKFSGTSLPPVKYSASGSLYVKFTSDGSVQNKGFRATLEAVLPGDFEPIVGHPMACTFDSGICSWTQSTSDDFDWTLHSGNTPSANTGPSEDHTTGTGAYIYIETSNPRRQGDRARLFYSSFTGNVCLRFYRHMFGSSVSALNVYVGDTLVRHESGNKGNNWVLDQVQIQGSNVKVELEGVQGSGYTGDIALDDFVVVKKCIPDFTDIPQQMIGFSGSIASPNYPNSYGDYQRCVWNITVPSGKAVGFTFSSFILQSDIDSCCSTDFIELRIGHGISPLLGKFCGNSVPAPVIAYSGSMLVKFASDRRFSYKGFHATYTAFDPTSCRGVPLQIYGSVGIITSPGYPHSLQRNWRCIWRVTVPSGMCARLVFTSFGVKYHANCNWEFVELRDGVQDSSPVLGKFCGTSLPPPQYACSGTMRITFSSSGAPGFQGFIATYNAIPVPGQPYLLQRRSTNLTTAWSWNSQLQAQFLIDVQPVTTNAWTTANCVNSLSITDCVVNSPSVVATDLIPYRSYRFRVRTKVLGEWSKANVTSVEFWTRMTAPSQSPSNVSAHSRSPSSLMVFWKPIPAEFVNGILLGYHVMYLPYKIGSNRAGQVVSTNKTKLELSGLYKHTNYSVRVFGFTAAGNGTVSQAVYAITDSEEPPAISNISDSTVVSWTGHQISLGCYATGRSPIGYLWTRDGHTIDGKIGKTHENALIVTPSSMEDFGTYTCTATNRDGTATHNVTLIRIENPVASASRGPSNVHRKSTESNDGIWKVSLTLPLSAFILILVVVIVFLCRRLKTKGRKVPDQVYDNVSMRNVDSRQFHGDIPGNNAELQYDVVELESLHAGSRYKLPPATNPSFIHDSARYSASTINTDSSAAVGMNTSARDCNQVEQHYQTLQVSTLDNLYGQLGARGRRVGQKLEGINDEIYDNVA